MIFPKINQTKTLERNNSIDSTLFSEHRGSDKFLVRSTEHDSRLKKCWVTFLPVGKLLTATDK